MSDPSKMRTMADMRKQQASADGAHDGKKKGANAFVGSGLNVIGRPEPDDDNNNDEDDDVINRIFKKEGVGACEKALSSPLGRSPRGCGNEVAAFRCE